MQTTILTWYWNQPHGFKYSYNHVNKWYANLRPNITRDVRFLCVTNCPDSIRPEIETIPIPETKVDIETKEWPLRKGHPQCRKRLFMYSEEAADYFGERFVCTDIDLWCNGNIDNLIDRINKEDFIILRSTSPKFRPYNGSMQAMKAGARSKVWKLFTPERAALASRVYIGSDQAFISFALGFDEAVFTEADGVYQYGEKFKNRFGGMKPTNMNLLFYPGAEKSIGKAIIVDPKTANQKFRNRKRIQRFRGSRTPVKRSGLAVA